MGKPKILIIGHARHGKTSVGNIIEEETGLKFMDSSRAASELFLYDKLKDKYGYKSPEECFEDRVNHRSEWYDLICEFNEKDPTRLVRYILERGDGYVGLRSNREFQASKHLFTHIVFVFDRRKPLEPKESFDVDYSDVPLIHIWNNGSWEDLRKRVRETCKLLKKSR